uniref:Sodium bicarbonate transporter-like protein 11 n=1 Tax=Sinocyclocheilus rhinocerous TaxID=307959 RepID=A0A673G110_9TELE
HYFDSVSNANGFALNKTMCKCNYVKLVDFQEEVRAHRDLDGFLAQASILLDERASSLDEVLRRMLEHVATDGQGSCNAEEVMSALFTDAGGQEANVHLLTETIQGVTATATGVRYQQSWLCVLCNVKSLQRRCVCVSRLERPQNWGVNCCEVRYVILILAPPRTKSTKTAIELGRTFATLFSDISFRQKLLETKTQEDFKQELVIQRQRLSTAIQKPSLEEETDPHSNKPLKVKDFLRAGRGIYEDLCRRLPLYLSDFTDGILDANRSLLKYTTTAIFLYIAILLPAIAFGSLNDESTQGEIGLCSNYKLSFTDIPLLWPLSVMSCSLCAMCPLSSTEEVIALFISIAFVGDALKGTIKIFHKYYHGLTLVNGSTEELHGLGVILHQGVNGTENGGISLPATMVLCTRERPILCLLLMLGTLWLGYALFLIKRSPFLHAKVREVVSDCALPISVVIFSFVGSYLFIDIQLPVFNYQNEALFRVAAFDQLTGMNVLSACGLGFLLALLIFIDQNIVVSLTNAPENRLLKGTAYHWDLMLSGFINILMSVLGLPWMHAAFPHSTLHVRQLARVEQRTSYPPTHYIRRVPQRKVHYFTGLQIVQLIILCAFGMYPLPYMKMIFPLLMIMLIPIRNYLLPKIIEAKYLDIIDSQHM